MKWLFADGDLWLLVMIVIAGVLPGLSDAVRSRPFGGEATLGGLAAFFSAVALARRLSAHLKARSLTRRLLR